jgi:hypothetical protein
MKEMFEKKIKQRGTFIIKVENHANSTWQGEVIWAEKNKAEKFRSALELFKLMNGAMELQCEQSDIDTGMRIG